MKLSAILSGALDHRTVKFGFRERAFEGRNVDASLRRSLATRTVAACASHQSRWNLSRAATKHGHKFTAFHVAFVV